MLDEARRGRVLPIWGDAPLPKDRDRDHRADHYSFGGVFKLVWRAWPFLYRYIEGRWASRALSGPAEAARDSHPTGYLYMPFLVTGLVAWLVLGAQTATSESAARWSLIGEGLFVAMAACAWATLATRNRLQAVFAIAGALAGFLATFLFWVTSEGYGPKFTALGTWAAYAAGWFVRFERRDGATVVSFRVGSHLLYYYLIDWVRKFVLALLTAIVADLLYKSILVGEPLSPLLAGIIGGSGMADGEAARLTTDQRLSLQWWWIGLALGAFLLERTGALALRYYSTWIQQMINQDLRVALVERWHKLSMRHHAEQRVGDAVYRIYQDSAQVTQVITRLVTAFSMITALVSAVFLLMFFDPFLALLAAGIGLPVLAWARWFSPRLRTRALVARERNSDLTSRIQEIFSGLRVIKAYGREDAEQARFEDESVVAFNAAFKARSLAALTMIVSFVLTGVVLLVGLYFMAVWAAERRPAAAAGLIGLVGLSFTVWNVQSFRWVQDKFFESAVDVRTLSREWTFAQDQAMGLHRVFDILDIEPDVQDKPDAIPMPPFETALAFEKVSFGYEPERPILSEVSFTATPGTITAIVGPTGSGKSTLMALALRLFDPEGGRITVDGRDIRDLQVESLRDNISIALQENILFGMSIADNIRYVVPDASRDEVEAAARVACAHDFIMALPEGYDTVLGDRGGRLSAGQRQRLSIARAVIKDAPILILDEPTAALDAATEHQVLKNLHDWGQGRAIFIVTHRLSTIRQADQILYLSGGKVCEAGSHAELMQMAGGGYRKLVTAESEPALAGAAE
ncbi:ABC transporter ATP-binding protein [Phenylobacterium terrae]|uniref:ABC transporter ATP-binding protein n=1 Tax=Phenylobacterium terrae TaxID=2665495 RepID=A0ABW4MY86_9CAUL